MDVSNVNQGVRFLEVSTNYSTNTLKLIKG